MSLGPNLVRNPDCILALGEWGMGSLGPGDAIEGSGDFVMGSQNSVLPHNGTYKLILTYESDGPFRATVGSGTATVPAHVGTFEADFVVTSGNSIAFVDRDESATYRILHVEVREIS